MKIRGKRGAINIWMHSGTQSVPAIIFGPYLALHKQWADTGLPMRGWAITHIPTGRRILPANNQKQGRALIAELLKLDWARKDYQKALASDVRRIHRTVR